MKAPLLSLPFVIAVLLSGCSGPGAWDLFHQIGGEESPRTGSGETWFDPGWGIRQRLVFDNAAGGDLYDFPVLIKLTTSRVDYSAIETDASDLRFIDVDTGNKLAHEIECWTHGGTSWIWVKVPKIDAGSTTDGIFLYYDASSVSSIEDANGLWASAYRGVWHLDNDDTDSTSYNNDVTARSSANLSGRIGYGESFSAGSTFMRVNDHDSLDITGALTITAWVKKDFVDSDEQSLVAKTRKAGFCSYQLLWVSPDNLALKVSSDGTMDAGGSLYGPGGLSAGVWYHVAGVYDGAKLRLYVNGTLFAEQATSHSSLFSSTEHLIFAASEDGSQQRFKGSLDEVRIAATTRSASWLRAQWLSMTDQFVTFGAQESSP